MVRFRGLARRKESSRSEKKYRFYNFVLGVYSGTELIVWMGDSKIVGQDGFR